MGRVWEAEVIVEGWYFKTKGVYYKSKREAERVVSDAAGWWLVFGTQGPQAEDFERVCVYVRYFLPCPLPYLSHYISCVRWFANENHGIAEKRNLSRSQYCSSEHGADDAIGSFETRY